jgi:hypothetical protein
MSETIDDRVEHDTGGASRKSDAKRCYLFDIDGTVANLDHRLPYIARKPKDWQKFFASVNRDLPILHIVELARDLAEAGVPIVYVSGRSDECRADTLAWLSTHDLPMGPLYMRHAGDRRPDYVVKAELLDEVLGDGFFPSMAFDDRDQVVAMWRNRGVPCAQVAPGNF